MFKKTLNLKGSTVNLVQGFLNNIPTFRLFCFFVERTLWVALAFYRINFKITNLDSFKKTIIFW